MSPSHGAINIGTELQLLLTKLLRGPFPVSEPSLGVEWQAPPDQACRGSVFVDATFNVDRFKVGLWGPAVGGRVFHSPADVYSQQGAELERLAKGLRFIVQVRWPVFPIAGGQCGLCGFTCQDKPISSQPSPTEIILPLAEGAGFHFLEWVPRTTKKPYGLGDLFLFLLVQPSNLDAELFSEKT